MSFAATAGGHSDLAYGFANEVIAAMRQVKRCIMLKGIYRRLEGFFVSSYNSKANYCSDYNAGYYGGYRKIKYK